MKNSTAVIASMGLLIVSHLFCLVLLLPLAAIAEMTFCADFTTDGSSPIDLTAQRWHYGCGSAEDGFKLQIPGATSPEEAEKVSRSGFGLWFTQLHSSFLGVYSGDTAPVARLGAASGRPIETQFHLQVTAAYLGKIWFGGWLVLVAFVVVPRTDAWMAMGARIGGAGQLVNTVGASAA